MCVSFEAMRPSCTRQLVRGCYIRIKPRPMAEPLHFATWQHVDLKQLPRRPLAPVSMITMIKYRQQKSIPMTYKHTQIHLYMYISWMDTADGILHLNYPTTSLEAIQASLFNIRITLGKAQPARPGRFRKLCPKHKKTYPFFGCLNAGHSHSHSVKTTSVGHSILLRENWCIY